MNKLLIALLVVVSMVPCAFPQASTSSVSGTVRDQSGAVIPNATVTLENTGTNAALTTSTCPSSARTCSGRSSWFPFIPLPYGSHYIN